MLPTTTDEIENDSVPLSFSVDHSFFFFFVTTRKHENGP